MTPASNPYATPEGAPSGGADAELAAAPLAPAEAGYSGAGPQGPYAPGYGAGPYPYPGAYAQAYGYPPVAPAPRRPASGWWGCMVGLGGFLTGNILGAILAVAYWFSAGNTLEELADTDALLQDIGFVVTSSVGLWAGLLGGCWLYSRSVLKTSFSSFYRLRYRGLRDIGLGLLVGLGVRAVLTGVEQGLSALGVVTLQAGEDYANNTDFLTAQLDSVAGIMLAAFVAMVGAPLFEELFFRGLVMGSMRRVLQTGWAIALSSLVFGMVHFQGGGGILGWLVLVLGLGWMAHIESRQARGFMRRQVRNRWRLGIGVLLPVVVGCILAAEGTGGLAIMALTGVAGVTLAVLRVRTGRLGPSVVAHSAFNASAVLLLALGFEG